jgi:hypothetical protein
MSSDDFWRDPIPSETKQAACRELKVMEELFSRHATLIQNMVGTTFTLSPEEGYLKYWGQGLRVNAS